MSYINPHSDYIDKRIYDIEKRLDKWNILIIGTHDQVIKDFNTCVFTNLIRSTFTCTYLKKHKCSDCGNPAKERCHGIGEERSILLRRALEKVYPDTTKSILLRDIIIQFLKEHKTTKFTFKCKECHSKEKYVKPTSSC